ncbi:hypothetical protein H5410_028645 [Solanum commersonii]|uniref:Uncharacterized protein n=1 Tax=Solanum commersonii TaxID=4109 RepID=A0A9J5Z2P4_SOLCO|nr:hypothetical protein H5410_028645 [Solanum commersonii]
MLRASISCYKDEDAATTGVFAALLYCCSKEDDEKQRTVVLGMHVVDIASYRKDFVYCCVGLLFKRRFWVLLELEMDRVMEWADGLLKLENKRG